MDEAGEQVKEIEVAADTEAEEILGEGTEPELSEAEGINGEPRKYYVDNG